MLSEDVAIMPVWRPFSIVMGHEEQICDRDGAVRTLPNNIVANVEGLIPRGRTGNSQTQL